MFHKVMQGLVGMEEDFENQQREQHAKATSLQAEESLFKAVAEDRRGAAVVRDIQASTRDTAENSASVSGPNTDSDQESGIRNPSCLKRKRRGQEIDIMKSTSDLFRAVAEKYCAVN
ncbi:hypothetical protein BGW38_003345 [Lunasporangiospora selenospora]|uniref:Uncharacterized protein n=1 Tax=Lunasporangiospora selenospora TaxID=979761 RepID=A0A9P6FST9_9FUNG|nr:hypothetical protein BGW38_003345 [Lunasporangiospora selenospora]